MASAYHCKIMKSDYTHIIININCIAYRDYEEIQTLHYIE